ncbi:MAG: 23S rRNA (guanine(745)-N(1))-methyltransferase [Methylococcaceae bacterium]|nr:23S rRNA (guanine(745)-N(1))-methyltransferase [Methylococcaceae bacterium]
MPYICPVCQTSLIKHIPSQGYFCKNKHHFDLAKEGYLNLLPSQHKKSKEPGDSRVMMRARRHFLEDGFYQPMAKAVVAMIENYKTKDSTQRILDVGCGEGYYCRQIEALSEEGMSLIELHGIDIAKNAILAAAKKQGNAHFIVASNKRLPYANNYFDWVMRIYAPSNDAEIERILKQNGHLLIVTPGPRHLWQLKEFIYKKVNEHNIQVDLPKGFKLVESQQVSYKIQPNQEQRMALLQMTPFAWRVKGETANSIRRINRLVIETDFILTLATKL